VRALGGLRRALEAWEAASLADTLSGMLDEGES